MTNDAILIEGASLADLIYEITLAGGEQVIWNVTKLQRACNAGEFGPPLRLPTALLQPPDFSKGYLDRAKIERLKRIPDVLHMPAIAVRTPPGSPHEFYCFVDGNHRIVALQELGVEHFTAFAVPHERERAFRVTEDIIRGGIFG